VINQLSSEQILFVLNWVIHFGDKRPRRVTCEDCLDFKAVVCSGGDDPVECMKSKADGEFFWVEGPGRFFT
jgi:hypothetical protein